MKKKQKNLKPKVFFNASVVLSGLRSPDGGSGKLLSWAKSKKIKGYISEIVLDEAKKHASKLGLDPYEVEDKISFLLITKAPEKLIEDYRNLVVDPNDIHLFTSSELLKVDYLVSLDKKHVLSISGKIKKFKIVSPGELIMAERV